MNIILENITDSYHLIVAEIKEDNDYLYDRVKDDLSASETQYYLSIKHIKRKTEWLGVRYLLSIMTGKYYEIKYSEHGNPYIIDNLNISITHSKQIFGIILSKTQNTGIDVEFLSSKILKTAEKFITKEEIDLFTEEEKIKRIYINWCAKETLFKIKKHGGFDFKDNFIITPDKIQNTGTFNAMISKNDCMENYTLSYQFIHLEKEEIIVVWH
jgi:phosphopantetheinyl transferase